MLWAIFPNFMGNSYTGYIGVDITFSPFYQKTSAGLGASYLAEGYWNFGWLAVCVFPIFGMILCCLDNAFERISNSSCQVSAIKCFVIVCAFYYLSFLPRGELNSFARNMIYYVVIPAMISKIKV